MRMPFSSRALFLLSALGLALGAHMADYFSTTHIFNDRWPPHAKFHTGQTLSMSILLGVMSAFFAWRKTEFRSPAHGLQSLDLERVALYIREADTGCIPMQTRIAIGPDIYFEKIEEHLDLGRQSRRPSVEGTKANGLRPP
jgi:hypothetical protein